MAKKHIDYTVNFEKGNGNTAIAEILMNGKVDVTIKNHEQNVTVIHHYDDVPAMTNAMSALNYKAIN